MSEYEYKDLSLFEDFARFPSKEREECLKKNIPYSVTTELTNRCAGSCGWCYNSSVTSLGGFFPTERVLKLIDEYQEIGVKELCWTGGDALLHPDWYAILSYSSEKGFLNMVAPNPMSVSKGVAKKLCQLNTSGVSMHISSIDPGVYGRLHTDPKSLDKKIQGYRNLLEAGYPADKIAGIITLTKPSLETAEETINWFLDEMGAKWVCLPAFKMMGFAQKMSPEEKQEMEPPISGIKRVSEYLARKLGAEELLRTGTSHFSAIRCKTHFEVKWDGRVIPCTFFEDAPVGNVLEERLSEIFQKSRDELLFNFEVEGYCGQECPNRDICFGCRGNAWRYLGDRRASDPKCWWNPANQEAFLST